MATWLVKTEPSTYSFSNLEKAGKTRWDGVGNPLALKHIRAIAKGDAVFVYHTGDEKQIVGLARAESSPYPDPKSRDPRPAAFDLAPVRALKKPVTLDAIKADDQFKDWELVRIASLAVMPVPAAVERALLKMAGE